MSVSNESPADELFGALRALNPLVRAAALLPPCRKERFRVERIPEGVRVGIWGSDPTLTHNVRMRVYGRLVTEGRVDENAPLHVILAALLPRDHRELAETADHWLVSATVDEEDNVRWMAPNRAGAYPSDWVDGLIRELGECLTLSVTAK